MKQSLTKSWWLAVVLFCAAPVVVFAQKDKDAKEKEMQTIVITRNGNIDQKTVIEINGDKVTVNGKDAKGNKDVHVNVNTIKGLDGEGFRVFNRTPGAQAWNFNMDKDHMSFFNEDSNRAMLGITTMDTNGSNKEGAEVASVNDNSAADKAGLKKGDVLVKIGDKKIESAEDVTTAVRAQKPGDKVEIKYLRDGKEQKTTAELQNWKGINLNLAQIPRMTQTLRGMNLDNFENFPSVYMAGDRPKLGLSIQDTEDGNGVEVLEVEDESNAAKAGLKEGDIILSIDGKDVKGTEDVTRTLRSRDKYTFDFSIQRNGKTQKLEVKMPKKLKQVDL
jgi:serine protease Do